MRFCGLAAPEKLPADLQDLCQAFGRVRRAMLGHPTAVGGPKELDSDLIATGALVAKEGAEGLVGLASAEKQVGVSFVVSDGDPERRASKIIALTAVERLELLPGEQLARLKEQQWPAVTDSLGDQVGELRPAF